MVTGNGRLVSLLDRRPFFQALIRSTGGPGVPRVHLLIMGEERRLMKN